MKISETDSPITGTFSSMDMFRFSDNERRSNQARPRVVVGVWGTGRAERPAGPNQSETRGGGPPPGGFYSRSKARSTSSACSRSWAVFEPVAGLAEAGRLMHLKGTAGTAVAPHRPQETPGAHVFRLLLHPLQRRALRDSCASAASSWFFGSG